MSCDGSDPAPTQLGLKPSNRQQGYTQRDSVFLILRSGGGLKEFSRFPSNGRPHDAALMGLES